MKKTIQKIKKNYLTIILLIIVVFSAPNIYKNAIQYTKSASDYLKSLIYSAEAETVNPIKVFADYQSWPKVTPNKEVSSIMYNICHDETYYSNKTQLLSTFLDLNGDGLADMIYCSGDGSQHYNNYVDAAVFLNKGDMKFDLVYKCARRYNGTLSYYGDCDDGWRFDIPDSKRFSNTLKQDDKTIWALQYLTINGSHAYDMMEYDIYSANNHSWVDINGDGLIDFIGVNSSKFAGISEVQILLNKGDVEFEKYYYCKINERGEYKYYGDCAQ